MPLENADPQFTQSLNSGARVLTNCYYLWIEFEYPTVKWEGRDIKIDWICINRSDWIKSVI
jgi:hypothetical protein